MKISIAMATYNGAKYLQEQLDSFVAQTQLPDELIVSDDGSSDETLAIVENFARQAPLKVSIYQNDHNLGFAMNFETAIRQCSGDIIFLSDQDDVWFPHKLMTVLKIFIESPKVLAIINNANLVDTHLYDTGLTKLGQIRSLGLQDSDFLTGCCTAFRGSLLPLLLPFPAINSYVHDTWLHALVNRLNIRRIIEEPLQYYRRHDKNTSTFLASSTTPVNSSDLIRAYKYQDPRPWCQRRIQQLAVLRKRIDEKGISTLAPLGMVETIPRALQSIDSEIIASQARLHLLQYSRIQRFLPALWMYIQGQYKVFKGWKSLAKDLYHV